MQSLVFYYYHKSSDKRAEWTFQNYTKYKGTETFFKLLFI